MASSITVTADDQQGICRYSSFLMDMAQFNNDITIAKVQPNYTRFDAHD